MNVVFALLTIVLAVVDHNAAGKITQAHPKMSDANDELSKLLKDSAIKSKSNFEVVRAKNDASSDSKKPTATNGTTSVHFGGMKRILFKNGTNGRIGTSYHAWSKDKLLNAFQEQHTSDDEGSGWCSQDCPQLVWYQFNEAKVPAGVSFRSYQVKGDFNFYGFHVNKWQFIASKDPNCNTYSPWTTICQDLSGENFVDRFTPKECYAADDVQEKYYCFGIRVLKGTDYVDATKNLEVDDDRFALTFIHMWEKFF